MAEVTICSDFEALKNKVWHCFHCFPIYFPWSDGTRCHDLSFLEKVSFIPIPKKGNAKECSNYCTIALISHASKVMLKILQARLQQYVNCELPNVQAGFRKGRGTRDKLPTSIGSSSVGKSKRVLEKHLLLLCWLHQSLWLYGSQQAVENS